MKAITRHTGILEYVKRLPASYYGNPRYLVRINGEEARTMPDSMEAYGAVPNNFGKRVSCEIGMHYGKPTIQNVKGLLIEDAWQLSITKGKTMEWRRRIR